MNMTLYCQNYVGYADTWKWNNQPKHDMYCILQNHQVKLLTWIITGMQKTDLTDRAERFRLTLFWVCNNFLTTIFKLTKKVWPFELPAEVLQLPVKRLKQHVQPLNLIIYWNNQYYSPTSNWFGYEDRRFEPPSRSSKILSILRFTLMTTWELRRYRPCLRPTNSIRWNRSSASMIETSASTLRLFKSKL